jgi:hypothetical protein
MKDIMINKKSDESRTNQVKITSTVNEVADKLYDYLTNTLHIGIESFSTKDLDLSQYEGASLNSFQKQHRAIKREIKKILDTYNKDFNYKDIQYFLSSTGDRSAFFISPNTRHSGWKKLFPENKEKILNLVFKFYLISQGLDIDNIHGLEELFLIHSIKPNKSKNGIEIWGQNVLVKYNRFNVVTLTLTRKHLSLLITDSYMTFDGDDLGELLLYEDRENGKYYFDRFKDARQSNKIKFMTFEKQSDDFKEFKQTQVYHYQILMSKFENFLTECDISFEKLDFQADCYLDDPFIKNRPIIESLEIINNTGVDLTESEQKILENLLCNQEYVATVKFYQSGKSISNYKKIDNDDEDDSCWNITEVIDWSSIKLRDTENYLVLNKLLDEETGSMAYQTKDGLWYRTSKIDQHEGKVDFYSQLKRDYSYLKTGKFFSTQGLNLNKFGVFKSSDTTVPVILKYQIGQDKYDETNTKKKNNSLKNTIDDLREDTQTFADGKLLDDEELMMCYLEKQTNKKEWQDFYKKYKLKLSPKYEKSLIEIAIKNWMKKSIKNGEHGFPIHSDFLPKELSEKQFSVISVRSPRGKEGKAVVVNFLYRDGYIYIKSIIHDLKEIKNKFKFLRRRGSSLENLIDDQQYFVDEEAEIHISCYTDDFYTPTLIGRDRILEELEAGSLQINRSAKKEDDSKLFPLITYYSSDLKPANKIRNMICLDLKNHNFVQYFVPPAQALGKSISNGFKVYHMIGNRYSGEKVPTSELIEHPIIALHFGTLTQDILKISENSKLSLLQKVAKVLIEN